MREQLNVLAHAIRIEPFDRFDNSNVENAPPLLQEAPIGNFMCKRVLESVFKIRKQPRLIEKLRGLQPSEAKAKFVLRLVRDGLEQRERNILPHNGGGLQKPLFFRRKSINPSSQ